MVSRGAWHQATKDSGGRTDLSRLAPSSALLVQLMIAQDRRDLAQSTYAAAKRFGDDSLLVQVMEAWVGLKAVRPGSLRGSLLPYLLSPISHELTPRFLSS